MTPSTGNMEVEKVQRKVFICLPKKHIPTLSKSYALEHGLFVSGLNPYLNEGYVQAYFREWGTVTGCKIMKVSAENNNARAYVRFASENEADTADWNGPHYIGGTEVIVRRVVSPKAEGDTEEQTVTMPVAQPRPRRSMGLGYILEDAQWLDD